VLLTYFLLKRQKKVYYFGFCIVLI
jgi:hypothetical protein